MGKKKVGKQRKDKFYQLAKETGYRSRAAFKLIQLNRKFEFLQKSRVCLDLCAAPGGWMQVAKQNMPVSSIVIGVDLFPIKTISGCVSIVGDITTDQCYHAISKELQNWKVDVVLHDGAPNVGQNWLYDAYQQVCLTLSSFKLATKFLKQGGWFVTKVFRSKDYNALLWVLKQFFKKVHATKPQASRNESAEIFVVCSNYLAPAKIDPKFLDPRHVFKELDMEPLLLEKNLLKPHKVKKVKAEGYSDNQPIYTVVRACEFITSENPLLVLQAASAIEFEDDDVAKQAETTPEIRECCKDIKVLGRKDLKALLLWAKIMKERLYPDKPKENVVKLAEENSEQIGSEDELHQLDNEISQLENEEHRELKRKKKKSQKERAKLRERLDLKMVHKGDDGPLDDDPMQSMFSINQITSHKVLNGVVEQSPDIVAESDEGSSDEEPVYRARSQAYSKDALPEYYEYDHDERASDSDVSSQHTDRLGLSDEEENDEEVEKKKKKVTWCDDEEDDDQQNPLTTDLDYRDPITKREQRAQFWFNKDVFKNLEKDDDEEFELKEFAQSVSKQGGKVVGTNSDECGDSGISQDGADSSISKDSDNSESDSEGDRDDSYDSDSDYSVENEMASNIKVSNKTGDFEIAPKEKKKKRKLDEEGLALGSLMIQSKKKKQEIVDAGWNRYTFNDSNLPDWFKEYAVNHMRKEAPVPKELVAEYSKKKDELNVRPIKKVIEAKARKKKRTLRKLEQAKKKIEGLLENPDVSEKEKARQIQRMHKKAKEKKPEVTYVVARKHNSAKRMPRPKGVKGRYKVVDPRMKKDSRKEKQLLKTKKGRKQLAKKKR